MRIAMVSKYRFVFNSLQELDVKAGGGQTMRLGMVLRQWLVKLEWFSTLFPRIPVPIQQKLQNHLAERFPPQAVVAPVVPERTEREQRGGERGEATGRNQWNRERRDANAPAPSRDWDRDRDREGYKEKDRRKEDGGRSRELGRDRGDRYRGDEHRLVNNLVLVSIWSRVEV